MQKFNSINKQLSKIAKINNRRKKSILETCPNNSLPLEMMPFSSGVPTPTIKLDPSQYGPGKIDEF